MYRRHYAGAKYNVASMVVPCDLSKIDDVESWKKIERAFESIPLRLLGLYRGGDDVIFSK